MNSENRVLQALVDCMNSEEQKKRANSGQLTLGKLIEKLELLPPDTPITGLGALRSYRGYYADLAFEPEDGITTVGVVIERCRAAMGREFTGYKGGEFLMGENTPLWVSGYGYASGLKLMGLEARDGALRPVTMMESW